jgi:hypothetical protein
MTDQSLAITRARNKAFRWPKGVSGNPGGQSRHYHVSRKLAGDASPAMMEELIRLARHAEDERVRSVCLIAVLDRAGIRPIEKPEEDPQPKRRFDPDRYSFKELDLIEAALKLIVQGRGDEPAKGGASCNTSGDDESSE